MKSEVSPEDHPVFLQADDLLAVRFRFLFISDASKGVGKAIAFSGIVVDEYVSAGTIMPTHRMNHRPPKVANGVKTLTKIADPEYAMEPPDKSIIEQPELALYYEGFGDGSADNCLVAEEDGKVVGAVWTRIMNDYGHLLCDFSL